jgi:FkbM family methyltransferase
LTLPPQPLTKLKQCRNGPMLFLRADKYIGAALDLYGEYCRGESDVFAQILSPGQIVAEAGANIGAHTIQLAQLVGPAGQVLAFEPQRVIFQLLCANIALNEVFQVHASHAAAGATAGTLSVPAVDYAASDSNFGAVSLCHAAAGEIVPVIALDTLALPSLRLLKIDVEGMEAQVLAGARQQIARHRPVLYVENDRQDNSAALIALIESMGYDLWWHLARLFNPDNHNGIAENIFGNVTSINMLCVPKEDTGSITGFRKVTGPGDWWETA